MQDNTNALEITSVNTTCAASTGDEFDIEDARPPADGEYTLKLAEIVRRDDFLDFHLRITSGYFANEVVIVPIREQSVELLGPEYGELTDAMGEPEGCPVDQLTRCEFDANLYVRDGVQKLSRLRPRRRSNVVEFPAPAAPSPQATPKRDYYLPPSIAAQVNASHAAAAQCDVIRERLSLSSARVDAMLMTPPAPFRWVVPDRIPCGMSGALVAPGGTGKGFAILQLCIAKATGTCWLGSPTGAPADVLMISAEDDRQVLHHRLHAVFREIVGDPRDDTYSLGLGKSPKRCAELLSAHLRIVDVVGIGARLTQQDRGGQFETTELPGMIADECRTGHFEPAVVVLDPASRFRGGDENSNEGGTRFVESMEQIAQATGAAVIAVCHANKASQVDGGAESQFALRGASAIVDGVRFAFNMVSMQPKQGAEFGIAAADAWRYVQLAHAKANHSRKVAPVWLERGECGALTPATLTSKGDTVQAAKADHRTSIIPRIVEKFDASYVDGEGHSVRSFVREFRGIDGIFRLGEPALRAAVDEAQQAGALVSVAPLRGRRGVGC